MKKFDFSLGVEKLINPITVGTLHFLQGFNDMLPTNLQNKMIEKSAKKTPTMGFVVDPYCFFLAYEILDINHFESLMPEKFKIVPCKIFKDDPESKNYFMLGSFSARTSAFMGNRVEAYVIAENTETGLLSWVIIDYMTNTISHDSANGLTGPSAKKGTITTNFDGHILVDMVTEDREQQLVFNSYLKNGIEKRLDQRLWIEGNLSVGYGNKLSKDGDVFSLKFDPGEMRSAVEIDIKDLELITNSYYRDKVSEIPHKILTFPYAQHYVSDAPGFSSKITSEEQLTEQLNEIDFNKIDVYSSDGFKKMIMLVPVILTLIIIILIILLILK